MQYNQLICSCMSSLHQLSCTYSFAGYAAVVCIVLSQPVQCCLLLRHSGQAKESHQPQFPVSLATTCLHLLQAGLWTNFSLQVSHHHTLFHSAKDKADKLHEQLQGITNDKKLAAQKHLSTTKLSAKLDKQVLLIRMSMAVTHISYAYPH